MSLWSWMRPRQDPSKEQSELESPAASAADKLCKYHELAKVSMLLRMLPVAPWNYLLLLLYEHYICLSNAVCNELESTELRSVTRVLKLPSNRAFYSLSDMTAFYCMNWASNCRDTMLIEQRRST